MDPAEKGMPTQDHPPRMKGTQIPPGNLTKHSFFTTRNIHFYDDQLSSLNEPNSSYFQFELNTLAALELVALCHLGP